MSDLNFIWFLVRWFFSDYFFISEQTQLSIYDRRTYITSAYQLFQSQVIEVDSKILEEVAFVWIITVAKNCLASEMLLVVL